MEPSANKRRLAYMYHQPSLSQAACNSVNKLLATTPLFLDLSDTPERIDP